MFLVCSYSAKITGICEKCSCNIFLHLHLAGKNKPYFPMTSDRLFVDFAGGVGSLFGKRELPKIYLGLGLHHYYSCVKLN